MSNKKKPGLAPVPHKACNETHPTVTIAGGTVLGASCFKPRPGYDIYIGLDSGMAYHSLNYPWSSQTEKGIIDVCYHISNMSIPHDLKNFKAMMVWLTDNLKAGKKVHIGCFGGHGRTGLVLAALKAHADGTKDAIQWVRKNHCKKGVESKSQVDFLVKHFGVLPAKPSKDYSPHYKGSQSNFWGKGYDTYPKKGKAATSGPKASASQLEKKRTFKPVKSSLSIWT